MIAKSIKKYWWLIIFDKTHFIHVHLLVLLHRFKYSLNEWMWKLLRPEWNIKV